MYAFALPCVISIVFSSLSIQRMSDVMHKWQHIFIHSHCFGIEAFSKSYQNQTILFHIIYIFQFIPISSILRWHSVKISFSNAASWWICYVITVALSLSLRLPLVVCKSRHNTSLTRGGTCDAGMRATTYYVFSIQMIECVGQPMEPLSVIFSAATKILQLTHAKLLCNIITFLCGRIFLAKPINFVGNNYFRFIHTKYT